MRRNFANFRFLIITAAAVILIVLAIGTSFLARDNKGNNIVLKFGNDMAGLFGRVVNIPTSAVGKSADSIGSLLSTFSENQKLRGKIDALVSDRVRLQAVEKENESLKANLDLKNLLTDYDLVTAQTISRSPTTFHSLLVIDQGSNSGIKLNQVVLSGSGLIGRVSQVNVTSSKITLISDSTGSADRVSVSINTSSGDNVSGVIGGYDKNANQLIMNQISKDAGISEGDYVMTSGLGGVIPAGIFVGTVTKIADDNYGQSKKVYIKPAGDLDHLQTVLVATKVGAAMEP